MMTRSQSHIAGVHINPFLNEFIYLLLVQEWLLDLIQCCCFLICVAKGFVKLGGKHFGGRNRNRHHLIVEGSFDRDSPKTKDCYRDGGAH